MRQCMSFAPHALSCCLFRWLCFLCTCSAAFSTSAQGISPAERLLFETNHMQGVRAPVTLVYTYRKEGTSEGSFDDEVQLDIIRVNPDKTAAASIRFLSGDRNIPISDLQDAHGNPALLGFLERDIVEMKRLTGGSASYFRKRIRLALADAQEVRPVRFRYAGKERQGQEVRIQPYLDDPMRERFTAYLHKSYVFILSEDVPGGLYSIRSASAEPDTKVPSGIVETMTLSGEKHLSQK
jgi:hypothetical protein